MNKTSEEVALEKLDHYYCYMRSILITPVYFRNFPWPFSSLPSPPLPSLLFLLHLPPVAFWARVLVAMGYSQVHPIPPGPLAVVTATLLN